jgi:hypothetical protein
MSAAPNQHMRFDISLDIDRYNLIIYIYEYYMLTVVSCWYDMAYVILS